VIAALAVVLLCLVVGGLGGAAEAWIEYRILGEELNE
jgi:hypothetical protein